ncbi:ankyrin and armadillo repeat-containing protein [Polypterus senegalus]|uniref:ankyrin and armadillo repeat-containing protein n=1 Tax=Polypterus senegalus TaxID=55291 RepID=UPI0019650E3F|nr:ankyrin and armadillo repeat-containing protein [Polypterus senegalus]
MRTFVARETACGVCALLRARGRSRDRSDRWSGQGVGRSGAERAGRGRQLGMAGSAHSMEVDQGYLAGLTAQRNASAFFEKFERSELQELLALVSCNWLLSTGDQRLPLEMPPGIISQMKGFSSPSVVILAPVHARGELDYREVHQIIRELTTGIYCFNQVPSVCLEANFDSSTSCQMPPAYYDTRVGQVLTSVDYLIKALWHGATMPKEKRLRFSELWRTSMDVDLNGAPQTKKDMVAEFLTAGLEDISNDPAYHGIYDGQEQRNPSLAPQTPAEAQLFMQHADRLGLKLAAFLQSVGQHENLFVFSATYGLSSVLRVTEGQMDGVTYQRLQQRLSRQVDVVLEHLEKKPDTCRDVACLHLISFLVPFLISLKKKMKIPAVERLLPPISEDKLKTEREFPPLLLGPEFRCPHFQLEPNTYCHLHGGIEFEVGTPPMEEVSKEVKASLEDLQQVAMEGAEQLLRHRDAYWEQLPLPVVQLDGRRFYVISLELESFYQQASPMPWWGAMTETMKTLRVRRLPLSDVQLHEQFKKTFGYRKALKCKTLAFGLKSAAERGLSAVLHTFGRKNAASRLHVLDEGGYSLVHAAAIHNRAAIICQLAMAGIHLNQRGSGHSGQAGLTPLHLAAQCGSLEALNCLLGLRVDHTAVDRRGWTAFHFASFYGNVPCLQALYWKDPAMVDRATSAEYGTTPLLLTAMSGSVAALRYLLAVGADWRRTDSCGNNLVQLAALYCHIDSLRLLIDLQLDGLPVWHVLVEMLCSADQVSREMAVRCLEVLSVAAGSFWEDIVKAGGVPALVDLLRGQGGTVQCVAAGVLCNVSRHESAATAIVLSGATPVLIEQLGSPQAELQSRSSLILADLARQSDHQTLIAQLGGIRPLVQLLGSEIEDVLVNAVDCIRGLCVHNSANQSAVVQEGGAPLLVELLTVKSDVLQCSAAAALAELARNHRSNQDAIAEAGAVSPLVSLISGRKTTVQVAAAMAVEALADHNPAIQQRFLRTDLTRHLLRLLKVFQLQVREQGAVALWSLAGQTLKQQKQMAEIIGLNFILDLVMAPSDRMRQVGCQAIIALSRNSRAWQEQICKEDGVSPLARLLRAPKTTDTTLLAVIKALGSLCVGVAHTNSASSQSAIMDAHSAPVLIDLLMSHQCRMVKVRAAQTLASLVLGNPELQVWLRSEERFSYTHVLELLQDQDVGLQAGYALTLFAYNSTLQQAVMLECGGISLSSYEPFLHSDDETARAKAAFQVVVLAKVIVDAEQVTLSARGVTILVDLLRSKQPRTVALTGELLASLCHTRAGIPDAITSLGAVEYLCGHLYSGHEQVRAACAIALGYLTFHRPAHRLLLAQCRNQPGLYSLLLANISQDGKICKVFTDEFKRQQTIGLPSQSLVINGGPPVTPCHGRPKTASATHGLHHVLVERVPRSKSAPGTQSSGARGTKCHGHSGGKRDKSQWER